MGRYPKKIIIKKMYSARQDNSFKYPYKNFSRKNNYGVVKIYFRISVLNNNQL